MNPSRKLNPTSIPESPQMLIEENFRDDSRASQICSKTLIKNLSNLTINACSESASPLPETSLPRQSAKATVLREITDELLYRGRGVRTLLSVQREKRARPRYMLLGRVRTHERIPTNNGLKGVKKESRPFKCPCSFCVSNEWDPSENARVGNYDTKPLQP
ncbi:developmental pluripotency-associated protein 3-like [Nomascus leucogenys]|uniref:developmental pluripotency-associated protein 3-like n=1 Tax=Nomascus leucogenys TaxID=61853 RepID=UPI00020AECB5|nr:developmental pluripotency-associated protein 3-like [Nomascus leucogenys]